MRGLPTPSLSVADAVHLRTSAYSHSPSQAVHQSGHTESEREAAPRGQIFDPEPKATGTLLSIQRLLSTGWV